MEEEVRRYKGRVRFLGQVTSHEIIRAMEKLRLWLSHLCGPNLLDVQLWKGCLWGLLLWRRLWVDCPRLSGRADFGTTR